MNNLSESKKITKTEELLSENTNRYVLFPIKYDKIWQFFKI